MNKVLNGKELSILLGIIPNSKEEDLNDLQVIIKNIKTNEIIYDNKLVDLFEKLYKLTQDLDKVRLRKNIGEKEKK